MNGIEDAATGSNIEFKVNIEHPTPNAEHRTLNIE